MSRNLPTDVLHEAMETVTRYRDRSAAAEGLQRWLQGSPLPPCHRHHAAARLRPDDERVHRCDCHACQVQDCFRYFAALHTLMVQS